MKKGVKILLILFIAAVLVFVSGMGIICIAEKRARADADMEAGDAIIVLGAQVKADGSLSVQLQWRLEAALAAWQARNRPVIVCGGQGDNEPCTEAECMKTFLMAHGIPESMILTDDKSVNTFQNMKNAQALLPVTVTSVLLVTSDYHLPRALCIARDAGFEAYGWYADTLPAYWLKNHMRECLAWVKYGIQRVTGWDLYLPI